jgi:hypothetical protein
LSTVGTAVEGGGVGEGVEGEGEEEKGGAGVVGAGVGTGDVVDDQGENAKTKETHH